MSDFTKDFMLWALTGAIGGLCTLLWFLFNKVNGSATDILLLKQSRENENKGFEELKGMMIEFQHTLAELVRKVDGIVIGEAHRAETINRLEKDLERIEKELK